MGQMPVPLAVAGQTAGTPHKVILTWKAPACATASCPDPSTYLYNIYRSGAMQGTYTQINKSPITGTTYTDYNVAAGTTYYYLVKTVLQSTGSNRIQVTIPTP